MANALKIFRHPKPVIAMVHLQYKGSAQQLIDEALTDIERLECGGVDGLLFENWGGDYTYRLATPEDKVLVPYVMKAASGVTKLPYGINMLPLDYEADFDIAKQTEAGFVQIDTFVDTVRTDYDNRFIIDIRPQDVTAYRRGRGLKDVYLFTNIQTKHYDMLPPNKKLETSARQAIQGGADALVVTGKVTGARTPKSKLARVKAVSGDTPIFIGSGFDADNAAELLPHADGVICGSAFKYEGITENPVDEKRVKRIMEAVFRARI